MKQTIYILSILLMLGALAPASAHADNPVANALEQVLTTWQEQYGNTENYSYVMASRTSTSDAEGVWLDFKITRTGQRVIIENELLSIFRDEHTVVMVLHDAQTIIVRSAEDAALAVPNDNPAAQISSMLDLATSSRAANGVISISFENEQGPRTQLTLEYDTDSGHLLSSTNREEYAKGGWSQQESRWSKYTTAPTQVAFTGTALEQVLADSELRERYRNYTIEDQRTNQNR